MWSEVPAGSIAVLAVTAAAIWSVVAWREWQAAAEPGSKTRLAWRPDTTPAGQEPVR